MPFPPRHRLPTYLWTSPHPVIATTHSHYTDTIRLLVAHHGRTPITFLTLVITYLSFSNRSQHATASLFLCPRTTLYPFTLFFPLFRQSFALSPVHPCMEVPASYKVPQSIRYRLHSACLPTHLRTR